jgi:hypothetical protein
VPEPPRGSSRGEAQRSGAPPSNVGRPAYGTVNETGALQSPWPALVTGQDRNCTVVPDLSPVIDVFDCNVDGIATHVLPPSVLYSQSYEARVSARSRARHDFGDDWDPDTHLSRPSRKPSPSTHRGRGGPP